MAHWFIPKKTSLTDSPVFRLNLDPTTSVEIGLFVGDWFFDLYLSEKKFTGICVENGNATKKGIKKAKEQALLEVEKIIRARLKEIDNTLLELLKQKKDKVKK